MFKYSKITLAITLSGLLVACNSESTTDLPVDNSDDQSISIAGNLVSPQSLISSIKSSTATKSLLTRSVTCLDVPEGYEPLSNAIVDLKNALGESITTNVTSDNCGAFEFEVLATLAASATQVTAQKEGFKALFSDIHNFLTESQLKVASTISDDASYEISGVKQSSDSKINLIITDTVSHKAVIGLASDKFTFELNDIEVENSSVTGSQNVANNSSSVVISIDASGSMSATIRDDNYSFILDSEGNQQTGYTIAAASAHQLIDMTKNNEVDSELSVLLFSSGVYPLTDEVIANNLNLKDENNNEVIFMTNSEDGFIKESATLHTLIDLYNPHSEMYGSSYHNPSVVRHTARVDSISSASYYPFSGGTAFYDSLDSALDLFSVQTNNPRVIALTDGADNSSSIAYRAVIDKALALNVPITVVAAGGNFDQSSEQIMKEIAEDTGSQYVSVTDISNLGGFLSGISTQVTFNYDVELGENMLSGDKLNVIANINGEMISREINID